MDRECAPLFVGGTGYRNSIVERRKIRLVQVQLDRAKCPSALRGMRKIQRPGQRQTLHKGTSRALRRKVLGHVGAVLRGHVSQAGHAKAGKFSGYDGEVWRRAVHGRAQPRVLVE